MNPILLAFPMMLACMVVLAGCGNAGKEDAKDAKNPETKDEQGSVSNSVITMAAADTTILWNRWAENPRRAWGSAWDWNGSFCSKKQ